MPVGAGRGHWIFWQAVVSVWVMGSEFWLSAGAARDPSHKDRLQPLMGKFETADSWDHTPRNFHSFRPGGMDPWNLHI